MMPSSWAVSSSSRHTKEKTSGFKHALKPLGETIPAAQHILEPLPKHWSVAIVAEAFLVRVVPIRVPTWEDLPRAYEHYGD